MPSYRDFRPSMRFQQTVALSPDGSMVAYADDTLGQFNVTIQPVSGGTAHRLTAYTDNTVRRVVWHPDGRSLIFSADSKGNENSQLYRIGLDDGKPEALTDNPDAQFTLARGKPVSPDGRRLAYSGNDRTRGDQDILIQDLRSGEVRRVYTGGGRVYGGYWSPDGAYLTAAEWIDGNSDHIVYLVPVDGGPAIRLTPEGITATYWLGPWLPDGSGFVVHSNAGREFAGLAVLDVATRQLRWLDTPDGEVEEVGLSADGRTLVWTVNVGGASRLRAFDLVRGDNLPVPVLPLGQSVALDVAFDGTRAAMLTSTPSHPFNVTAVDLDAGTSGQVRRVTDAAPVAADPGCFIEPELVCYPSQDGTRIPAWLYRPTTVAQPVGVVISIHGGPVAQERPTYQRDGFYQHLLSQGVAVLAPNMRGSWGYGKSYSQRLYRDWGGVDLDDLAGAAGYLRRQTWVDAGRIGLFGGSYGGFVVLSGLARLPDLKWAAGVSRFGISNLVTLAKASPPTWRTLVATVIGDPDTDAEFLLSRSPVTYADQIRAPLMIIQGVNDPRVPQQESDQIVELLRSRGVDVRYDLYPDEGHGFTKSENQIKADSDAADFLIAHLTRAGLGDAHFLE
jgi:dipeptidyl aminopeptidase/acylaminoacyl peptidase